MILPVLLIILGILPNSQDYPDAAALITNDITTITFTSDFRRIETRDLTIYVFNVRGREKYGEMLTKYDSDREELEVTKALTLKPDGSSLTPADKAIADLSSLAKFVAPAYTNLKVKTVVYSAVEPGDIIEYSYKKSLKEPSEDKHILGKIVFQTEDPISHKELILKVPEDIQLVYKTFGEVKYDSISENGEKVYRWWVDSIPRLEEEPYSIPASEFAPRVWYTNFRNWQEVAEWVLTKFEGSIELRGSFVQKAEELARGKSRRETIESIYRFIVAGWRDIPIAMKDAGFAPTPVQKIYENRYGDLKDKCALLIAMLRVAGIEAYPAYVSYSSPLEEIPSPACFQWVIAAIPEDDGYLYLDPRFPESLRFRSFFLGLLADYNSGFEVSPELIGKTAFVAMPDTGIFATIPVPDIAIPLSSVEMKLRLTEDGDLVGRVHSDLRGIYAMRARQNLRHKKERELELVMESILGNIKTGTKAIDWTVDGLDDPMKDVKIDAEFQCENFLTAQGDQINFTIPPPIFGFFDIPRYFTLSERTRSLTVVHPRSISFRIDVEIPEDFELYYLPEDFSEDNRLCSANAYYKYSEGSVSVESKFSFKQPVYKPDEYTALLSTYKKYARPRGRIIIFERGD